MFLPTDRGPADFRLHSLPIPLNLHSLHAAHCRNQNVGRNSIHYVGRNAIYYVGRIGNSVLHNSRRNDKSETVAVQRRISERCWGAGPEVCVPCETHTFGVAAKRADINHFLPCHDFKNRGSLLGIIHQKKIWRLLGKIED